MMKRSTAFILSMIIAMGILVAMMLSIASAAPTLGPKIFEFTKTTGEPTVSNGQSFTVTLAVYPVSLDHVVTFTIADPNSVYPSWLEIVTSTVSAPAFYDPQLDTVRWDGSIGPLSPTQSIQFQMRVKMGAAIPQAMVLTNTAYVGIEPSYAATLPPGSLPGSLPPGGDLPYGMYGAAWATLTVVPPACRPLTAADFSYLPTEPVIGQAVSFTASYTPADATTPGFAWSWGATGITATHTFASSGNHTVVMTATDGCASQPIVVQKTIAVPPKKICLPLLLKIAR